MDFRINTDTWFVFSILFIATLALCIALYISIPYLLRKKQLKRIKHRHQRKKARYSQIERKKNELKILDQEDNIQKLKTDLSDYLHKLMQSDLANPNLVPFFSDFEKIYPNFSHSLQEKFPSISANELKLCALLRLNLSSKEIAQLLNITQGSVNKARYRLRKKMNLTSKEELFAYILTI